MSYRKVSLFAMAAGFGLLLIAQSVSAGVPLAKGTSVRDPLAGGTSYSTSLPAWVVPAKLADTLSAPMVGAFSGTALSKVYFLNGTDGSDGLGFTYQLWITDTNPADEFLTRLTFPGLDGAWNDVTFSDAGSDASGGSTMAVNAPHWADGDPYQIRRRSSDGAPAVTFQNADEEGTRIEKDGHSAVWFWETDSKTYSSADVGLIDGGTVGSVEVFVVPTPSAAILGLLGLGTIGWLRNRKRAQ